MDVSPNYVCNLDLPFSNTGVFYWIFDLKCKVETHETLQQRTSVAGTERKRLAAGTDGLCGCDAWRNHLAGVLQ